MSELRIESLSLRNFKGVTAFELTPGGQDTDVFGENATGKTSLFDAFLWLLFDKDSANKKDFNIKTLQPSGESKHGFEHEVEGVLTLDGQQITLRKVYSEKWTKKRGSATGEFTGHTTDYHVDGVPVKLAEYKAKVASICDESVFRLLTDPGYFNNVMKWQDRRELLLSVCGDISDAGVIASNEDLALLPDILENRSLEDHRKVITARRSKINEEIKTLPTRIDEVSQGLPALTGTAEAVESELKRIQHDIQLKHQEKARLTDGGEAAEKRRQLAEAQAEFQTIENAARAAAEEERQAAQRVGGDLTIRIETLTRQIQERERSIESNSATVTRLEADMGKLRTAWKEIDAQQFIDTAEVVCAACGQDLPEERVQEVREKALAVFNRTKAESLERNVAEGKAVKERAGTLSLDNERLREEIKKLEVERDELADAAENETETVRPTITFPPEHLAKSEEIKTLVAEIAALGEGNTDALEALTAEITDMQQQNKDLTADLAAFEQVEQGKKRIEVLASEEKVLAAEYERLEQELYLCESFIRAKVGLLEGKINSKFQLARFKLFTELINGGLEETCVTTFEGVPFADLNGAAKINIGLDVIRTLQQHYGFSAPVWVDNSESVVELLPMECQVIRLVVSGEDKQLRVETKQREAVNG